MPRQRGEDLDSALLTGGSQEGIVVNEPRQRLINLMASVYPRCLVFASPHEVSCKMY